MQNETVEPQITTILKDLIEKVVHDAETVAFNNIVDGARPKICIIASGLLYKYGSAEYRNLTQRAREYYTHPHFFSTTHAQHVHTHRKPEAC